MIMGEFHMIPLKINNYNHMKVLPEITFYNCNFCS
jgi:hypothetical protein